MMKSSTLVRYLFVLFILLNFQISTGPVHSTPAQNTEEEVVSFSTYNHTTLKHLEYTELDLEWPINRSIWDGELNFTSTFGPRQKASDNFRYDFHRGIDIPTAYGTPVYAVADGYIRLVSINETHQQRDDMSIDDIYTSTVIQMKHNNSKTNQDSGIKYYFSNYLHINASRVKVSAGQFVSQGQLIGFVGDDENSNIPHLHFEIREDGLNQKHTTHPLEYLKARNTEFPEVLPNGNVFLDSNRLTFLVNVSNQELDFTGFHLTGSFGDNQVNIYYDMIEINHETETSLDLDDEILMLNNSEVVVFPYHYSNYKSHALYNVSIDLSNFVGVHENVDLELKVFDLYNSGMKMDLVVNSRSSQVTDDSSLMTTSLLSTNYSFSIITLGILALLCRKKHFV